MSPAIRSILVGVIAAFSLGAPVPAAEQSMPDPAAAAAQYTRQASELRASARRHADLARMHRAGLAGGGKSSHESIVQHCEKIASNLNAAATESEALAAVYRGMAAEGPAKKK